MGMIRPFGLLLPHAAVPGGLPEDPPGYGPPQIPQATCPMLCLTDAD